MLSVLKSAFAPAQLIAVWLLCCGLTVAEEGTLVIVGGGGTPEAVVVKTMELAGGPEANIVVLPQASSREDRGQSSARMFKDAGATRVTVVEVDAPLAARKSIEAADLIWFPGGQQSRLMGALTKADLVDTIVARHKAGTVIGGTSAGAAVMALDMIPHSPDEQALRFGNTPITKGLGLAPELIVDQHFVERSRLNRLLSAVIDRPQRIGVGIGERTAVLWHNKTLQVLGEGSVVILDARNAAVATASAGKLQGVRDIRLYVLKSGEQYDGKGR
ncbi:cyanophycinase [Fuerstiella marisgermanici]|uniref:Cyanophycinase n=1 Tax=Fuerstiella marisgermanici TaxID=1891926 RepID=A0A1P8WCD0_9PLAN|nr:cyanophycinase [Fuerstiella marisgermanici]APZ91706.1 Cyanophycinase [Fuerstiella marisgermanici]